MNKIKVLWFSNRVLDGKDTGKSGTWLTSLAPEIISSGKVELANVSVGAVNEVVRKDFGEITQWIVPSDKRKKDGLPTQKTIDGIKQAVENYKPDIIQIWGTEGYWGLLTARGYIKCPKVLLNIQGVIRTINDVFYGGLTNKEIMRCIGIKELIRPSYSLFSMKRKFEFRIPFEEEIIRWHRDIMVQSDWVRANVSALNDNFNTYITDRTLRNEFILAEPWFKLHNEQSRQFNLFVSASWYPYKGLHVLIRALSVLKRKYSDIKLHIAGTPLQKGIKRSGYERFVRELIESLHLQENVNWLGPVDGNTIVKNLQQADVFINPSYIESYSLALAEAMCIGTPCVVSYAGAMPELANNEQSMLFYTPGDYVNCANQIDKYLTNFDFSVRVSKIATKITTKRNNGAVIAQNQIKVYKEILGFE